MKNLLPIILIFFLSLTFIKSYAIPPADPEPGQEIPLDPISWVLLASGGALAAKKYYDYRKTKNQDDI